MSKTNQASRARAEALFKAREVQRADTPIAVREYRRSEQNARDQLHRLREARLARKAKQQ